MIWGSVEHGGQVDLLGIQAECQAGPGVLLQAQQADQSGAEGMSALLDANIFALLGAWCGVWSSL